MPKEFTWGPPQVFIGHTSSSAYVRMEKASGVSEK